MLEFAVHDKSDQYQTQAVPLDTHTELLWNQVSFAELVFDDDARVFEHLQPGARVRVYYDGDEILRGPAVERSGVGPFGQTTVRVEDDFRRFRGLGWPNPANAIGSQTSATRRYTGATETIVKAACAELSARLGYGWSIPTTTGLGRSWRVELRFHPLVDKLTTILEADELTWTIRGDTVDVHEGSLFPQTLTIDSGVLGDYSWRETIPTATRVVAGGEGEAEDRLLQLFIDTAREAEYAEIIEVFKDARMAQGITDLTPDADEALAEGAPRVSVTSTLQENRWFRFGKYAVGDRVPIDLGSVKATEVIRSVVIEENAADGLVVTPSIGVEEDDAMSLLGRQIALLGRSSRDLRRV